MFFLFSNKSFHIKNFISLILVVFCEFQQWSVQIICLYQYSFFCANHYIFSGSMTCCEMWKDLTTVFFREGSLNRSKRCLFMLPYVRYWKTEFKSWYFEPVLEPLSVITRNFWWWQKKVDRKRICSHRHLSCLVNIVVEILAKMGNQWTGKQSGFLSVRKALLASRCCSDCSTVLEVINCVGAEYPG